MAFTADDIARHVNGRLDGPGDLPVRGVEQLSRAQADQISFARGQKLAPAVAESKARVVLLGKGMEVAPDPDRAFIHVDDADVALAQVLALFAPPKSQPPAGVHPTAVVDPAANLGENVAIGPGCVIGADVTIGDNTICHANVSIMDAARVGRDGELYPNVVIRERCVVGDRAIIHSGAVIGADGFGYAPAPGGKGLLKIPHIGNVEIGDDVEIGANTCIDRGKHSATTIGDGTKIDNLCQIAHNVKIGRCCAIAAQTGLAGSVTVGDGVQMGGSVGVRDQLTIGDGARLAGHAAVMDNVPPGGVWGGYPANDIEVVMREIIATRRLPELMKNLRAEQRRAKKQEENTP